MTEHNELSGLNIHVPYAWEYADETARAAATGFVDTDIGKFARQTGGTPANSIWMLTAITPTWVSIGGTSPVDDTAYDATTWDGDTTRSPSKNAVRDKIESMGVTSVWNQVVNENGASFANFTSSSGTWSSDGTVIKQTDTGATVRRAKFNTKLVTDNLVFEAEMQIRTAGALRLAGLIVGFDGSGNNGNLVYLDEGGNLIQVDSDSITNHRTFSSVTINTNTWYKLRVVVMGTAVGVYLDGTLMGSVGKPVTASANADFIGFLTYQAEVWFRNIKAWNLNLPS